MVRLLACLLLALPAAAETVRFETVDGLTLVGDLHRAEGDAPTVICLPMYRSTRASYEPLVKPLLAKGIHVLALDLRGHGESAPDLALKVEARDGGLFRGMHKDVEAAFAYLLDRGFDTTRVGVVGASVGCSVAVDFTVRNPGDVRAVVLLTPGANYLGVPTLEHLKSWPGTRSFLFSSFEERKTTEPVEKALAPFDGANHMFFDLKGIHGTRMFGKVEGIEELIANFMESSLLGAADLAVPQWKEDDPQRPDFVRDGQWPARKVAAVTAHLMAWAVGDTLNVGAMVDGPFKGSLRFEIDGRSGMEIPLDNEAPETQGGSPWFTGKADGRTWVRLSLPGAKERKRLCLTLVPGEGKPVRLPGGAGSFALRLQPR